MLKIFNNLKPFFEDNYRRINVREYARIRGISPPSASTLLNNLNKEELLCRENDRNYIYYTANKENKLFVNLSRDYWLLQLDKIELLDYLKKELINPLVILFGSFSKAEIKQDSDVDLAIFTVSKNKINLNKFEKMIKRKIQVFQFKNKEDVKNKNLLNNILNGFIILGGW